jgi:hypothetical protein
MPDRAEANSAIVRCRTRVVPLRTVNKKLRERLAAQPLGTRGCEIRKTQEIAGKETE